METVHTADCAPISEGDVRRHRIGQRPPVRVRESSGDGHGQPHCATLRGLRGQTTTFTYDGNGTLVKKVVGSTTTVYVGNHYEKTGSTIRKYYYFNGQRVAMREGSTVYYLLTDHLGSTSAVCQILCKS